MRVNLGVVVVGAAQIIGALMVVGGIAGAIKYGPEQWLLLSCIVLGYIVSHIAKSKGYSVGDWFLYGALLFPVALLHILTKPPLPGSKDFEAKVALLKAAQERE